MSENNNQKPKRQFQFADVLPEPIRPAWRAVAPYLAAILFFLATSFGSGTDTFKVTALVCMLLAVAAIIFRFSTLRERFHLPLAVLTLLVLMDGLSNIYAVSGKFALQEFLKVLIAFCLGLLLLALPQGEGATPGRKIASILERATALAGVVSIDMLSTRWISTPVVSFLSLFTSDYADLDAVVVGTRMNSIFVNPNVFATCAGVGLLLSLGLVMSCETRRERVSHVACLFINALAFVLVFSRGAMAIIAVAFLVYLALEFKERRAGLFVLMVETLVLVMAATGLVAATSFQEWDGFQPVPLLCVILGAAALCALDQFVGLRVSEKLARHGKALLIVILAGVAALAVYVLAAYNLTGGTTLQAGESLYRSTYPEAGEYTVTVQADGPVDVTIYCELLEDAMMGTTTPLYEGDLSEATFTVPEGSQVVFFSFSCDQTVHIESVHYEGTGGSGSVRLGYKLLPEFIANRIQGVFANHNVIQRTVFFEDGLKIFRLSPLIGRGLGSFENGVKSVQSYYYETKYAHNHYIQALAETGIIGLVLFVGVLVVCAAAILLSRFKKKSNAHPLTPALGAALVFLAGHVAFEVSFSAAPFLPTAFGLFILINLCCGDAIPTPWLNRIVKSCVQVVYVALILVFFCLLCGNMNAASLVSRNPTFDSLETAMEMDKFEWADWMLSYVTSVPYANNDTEILAKADVYAYRLSQLDSNSIPIYLAEYYLQAGRVTRGLQMIEKYVTYTASDSDSWNSAFYVMQAYAVDTEEFREGVARVAQMMDNWNENNIGTITLDANSLAFLESMGIR